MEKRSFTADRWPVFKWSHDDKYFARMSGDGVLSIYETPSFGLLDKKSIKVSGMRDFSWSPTENILAYWVSFGVNYIFCSPSVCLELKTICLYFDRLLKIKMSQLV